MNARSFRMPQLVADEPRNERFTETRCGQREQPSTRKRTPLKEWRKGRTRWRVERALASTSKQEIVAKFGFYVGSYVTKPRVRVRVVPSADAVTVGLYFTSYVVTIAHYQTTPLALSSALRTTLALELL